MANWVLQGLRTGIKTTRYPQRAEAAAGVSPGRPIGAVAHSEEDAESLVATCPTGALSRRKASVEIDQGRCVHCFRCQSGPDRSGIAWREDYEWGAYAGETAEARRRMDAAFGRSLHIRFVDAGACGACMSEARQLDNPYYNMHRLGFFITPTPRNADVLLVAGPVSDAMRFPLRKAYDAMPTPKRVLAIGACAILRRRVWAKLQLGGRDRRDHPGRRDGPRLSAATPRHSPRAARARGAKAADGARITRP